MASATELAAIEKAKVLMVGAGGIGCELLKTLALTGFKDIHVIDLDTIEVSNLNRQFLFRKRHVGQSKAKVASEAVRNFKPDVNIVAHHANVKNPEFNMEFFKQFNVVLNGLDNVDARRHVNRLCLAAGIPLVESGSTGYLGQVTVHIKDRTECYECQSKELPKTYPVCTITSTPSKPVHCIVWAKDLLFGRLFGDKSLACDLVVHSKDLNSPSDTEDNDFFELKNGEAYDSYACRIFDGVFGHNIAVALKNENTWKARKKPCPLYITEVLPDLRNGNKDAIECCNGVSEHSVSAMRTLGLKNPQEVWSATDNARVFLQAIKLFLETRQKEIGNLTFDKDDQLAVEFVTAAANLRSFCFDIAMQSLFEAKGIAGNIVHAIATTNAIISGLIVLEAMKLLTDRAESCRTTYCLEYPRRQLLLMPAELAGPKATCYVCSENPLWLEVNTSKTKLREIIEKVVKSKLSVNSPIIMQGSYLLYETGDDLEENMVKQYNLNLEKTLNSFPIPITNDSVLTVEDLQQEFTCSIQIKHRESFDEEKEPDSMVLSGNIRSTIREQNGECSARAENEGQGAVSITQLANADVLIETEKDDDDEVVMVDTIVKSGTKRKVSRDAPEHADNVLPMGKRQKPETL